jgi:dolichyl-diphosphooligosaccharide--protein glycosyltransferase
MPIRWGVYLSEFDPYLQFRITQHIVENGLTSYFTWYDSLSWYPYGRDITTTSYPGVAITAALLYEFLTTLGLKMSLFEFTSYFPVFFGTLTVLAIYLFAKDIWGRSYGMLAALFLAFSSSHISRTVLGFFDDETVGIFAMLMFFGFYLRALSPNRTLRSTVIYSILAGLSLSFMTLSWGAFRYPMSLVVMFTGVLVILRRYTRKLLLTYSITYGLQFLITTQVPYLGYNYLTEWSTLATAGVLLLLIVAEIPTYVKSQRGQLFTGLGIVGILIAGFIILWQLGFVTNIDQKFLSVLYPVERFELPLIESVAEHRPATWASFFYEYGLLALLAVFGITFVIQRLQNRDVFLILFAVTALYFAASLVRLTLVLAPAFMLLAAIATIELGRPAVDIIRETVIFPKRGARLLTRVPREFGVAIFLILVIALGPTFWRALNTGYAPVTIVTSSIPTVPETGQEQRYQDWLETLAYIHDNLPPDAVVFSWWDYGYWITTVGGKHSLADNGTINSTQISIIAQTFLMNGTQALPTLKKYGVTHIAIFVTFQSGTGTSELQYLGYGEEGKWYWMSRIGNNTRYENTTIMFQEKRGAQGESPTYYRVTMDIDKTRVISNQTISEGNVPNDQTMLGMLMKYGLAGQQQAGEQSPYYQLAFASSNRFVTLWEVKYLKATRVTLEPLANLTAKYGAEYVLTGNVTNIDDNEPIGLGSVLIQTSADGGQNWQTFDQVFTDETGTYRYVWLPDAGQWAVRVFYEGKENVFLEAASPVQYVVIEKANVTLSVRLIPSSVVAGRNVTIFVDFNQTVTGAGLALEYRLGNGTWTTITAGSPFNGTFSYAWAVPANFTAGNYEIRAIYQGSGNYNVATSEVVTLVVTRP